MRGQISYTLETLPSAADEPRQALLAITEMIERGRLAIDGPAAPAIDFGNVGYGYQTLQTAWGDPRTGVKPEGAAGTDRLGGAPTIWAALDRFSTQWAEYARGKDGWKVWWRQRPQIVICGLEQSLIATEALEDMFGKVPDDIPKVALTFTGWSFAFRTRLALTPPN